MYRNMIRLGVAGAAMLAGLTAASPAAACLRTLQVQFEPGSAQIADKDAVAGFLSASSYGNLQRFVVRVSAPIHDLARRRASALADLLQAYGMSPRVIMIETERNAAERAVMTVYPPPHFIDPPTSAQATPPPRPACGG
jgi:hypothetical protein